MRNSARSLEFAAEVDKLMASADRSLPGYLGTANSDRDLLTAHLLASTDFSSRSRLQEQLLPHLHQLESQIAKGETTKPKRTSLMRPAVMVPVALAAVLLTLQCTWPGGIPGLVVTIVGAFKSLQVGPNTVAFFGTPEAAAENSSTVSAPIRTAVMQELYSRPTRSGLTQMTISPSALRFTRLRPAIRALRGFVPAYPRALPSEWRLRLILVREDRASLSLFYIDSSRTWRTMVLEVIHVADGTQMLGAVGAGMTANDRTSARVISIEGKQMALFTVEIRPDDYDNQLVWEDRGQAFVLRMEASTVEDIARVAARIR